MLTETQIGSEIATFTVPEIAGFLTAVAVIVTVNPGELVGAEAVYVVATPVSVKFGCTLPHGAAEQDTLQVTPSFDESLSTVAVTCALAPAATVEDADLTDTLMGGLLSPPPPHAASPINSPSASHADAQLEIFILARPFMTDPPELHSPP